MKKLFVGVFLLALTGAIVWSQRVVISPIVGGGGSGGGVSASEVTNIVNSLTGGTNLWANTDGYLTPVTNAPVVVNTTNLNNSFAYGMHFRKRGTSGNIPGAITAGSELGNMFWSGWDGTDYRQGGLIITKSDVDFTPTEAMTHMEFRFVPTNSGTYSEFFRMTTAPGAGGSQTNPMLTFQGVTSASIGLKRHARQLHVRLADDSTFGDIWAASPTMGSNEVNDGFLSGVLSGAHNTITTNTAYSVIAGGRSNWIDNGVQGGHFIGAGTSNRIASGWAGSLTASNNAVVSGRENWIMTNAHNSIIGAGSKNTIQNNAAYGIIVGGTGNKLFASSGFIGGGDGHILGTSEATDHCTIVGGLNNTNQGSDFAFIGGGQGNITAGGGLSGVIGGGDFNNLGGTYATIGGGIQNLIDGNSHFGQILGGVSNFLAPNTSLMTTIGNWGSNRTAKSILLSPMGKVQGLNELHVTSDASTNTGPLRVRAGLAAVYASVGGTLTNAITQSPSAGTAATNLHTYMVMGNTLTNIGDRIVIRSSGKFSPVADAKQIKIIFGSETVFDSGSQTANAGAWVVTAEIIRTGATSQAVNGSYSGTAESLFNTANSLDIAQTNGINTLLAINVTCAASAGVTNRTTTVTYYPGNAF